MGSIRAGSARTAATAQQRRSGTVRRVAGVAAPGCSRWPGRVALARRPGGAALRTGAAGAALELGPVAARAGAVAGAAGFPDAAHVDLERAQLARDGVLGDVGVGLGEGSGEPLGDGGAPQR